MSPYSEVFLSRPKDSSDGNSGLIEHSLKTAGRAREIATGLGFEDTAFYAGLLHDVGKLNPYYQILFSDGQNSAEHRKYLKAHAIFSALATNRLLKVAFLSKQAQKQILFTIAGHHSKLGQFTKSLNFIERDKYRFKKSLDGTCENLHVFRDLVRDRGEFKNLAWDMCLRTFQYIPIEQAFSSEEDRFVLDFLDFSSVFSTLIQADRGSFFDDLTQTFFDIDLDTDVLVRKGELSELRANFQKYLLSENTFHENLVILEAPTGIGKTKMFLDIVNKLSDTQRFERVFYFSPLLALTDDFEGKLFSGEKNVSVLNQADAEKVLVYNHAFTGSLLKKMQSKDQDIWPDDESEDPVFLKTKEHFERESFSKPLIITTTQRLLMVLYSNTPADKRKLVSFKNSFLIVDEVQTIPKVLLPNFVALLKELSKKYNSKILFVSATIPNELHDLPMLKNSKVLKDDYLQRTVKRIEYNETFDPIGEATLLGDNARAIFMFNTRRKALGFFESVSALKPDILYLSSGIKKRDRSNIIQKRLQNREGDQSVTVISTQVLEAGVDVSFSRMYRELAPLDNVVQAMGRLSREGECKDPLLTVFMTDGRPEPYSVLEVEESKKLLPAITSSIDLYKALPDYYKTVSNENLHNKKLADSLDVEMRKLNFDEVWAFVKKYALPDQLGDSVLVPDLKEYDEVRQQFLSTDSNKSRGKLKGYAELMAQLPGSLDKVEGLRALLDEDLLDLGILLPKKEALDTVYDPKVGLDKWVKK
ncbi:MAG: CRISPR-associated helicase Cas3' [Nitrososphaerota archaeon]|jgi:CRISPR-associated endonuclease/helicase Cas3|nr:CRISPR-associated helicase Cas3' [Nitrososphaerota archaeon]